jgi:hypothetical protein
MTTPDTAEALRAEQEKEYGTYTAKEAIFIDGVRAFNEGDPVPVSHVKRGVVDSKQVEKKG